MFDRKKDKEFLVKSINTLRREEEELKQKIRLDEILYEKKLLQQHVDNARYIIQTNIANGSDKVYVVFERSVVRNPSYRYGNNRLYNSTYRINGCEVGSFSSNVLAKDAVKHLYKEDILL